VVQISPQILQGINIPAREGVAERVAALSVTHVINTTLQQQNKKIKQRLRGGTFV